MKGEELCEQVHTTSATVDAGEQAESALDLPHYNDAQVPHMPYPGEDAAERRIWNCLANVKVFADNMKDKPKAYINQLVLSLMWP